MAKSNKQIEQEVLSLLDSQGISSKDVFELEELPPLNKYLVLSAANFVLKVQKNLRDAKKIDTGRLSSDIEAGEVNAIRQQKQQQADQQMQMQQMQQIAQAGGAVAPLAKALPEEARALVAPQE